MDLSKVLSDAPVLATGSSRSSHPQNPQYLQETEPHNTHGMYRQSMPRTSGHAMDEMHNMAADRFVPGHAHRGSMGSIASNTSLQEPAQPKMVSFELLLDENSKKTRARLPLRVNIHPHDTTDSILATAKNFHGIYEAAGVSFEDEYGNTLIASYDNLRHDSTVFVRVLPPSDDYHMSGPYGPSGGYTPRLNLGEPFNMAPPQANSHDSRPPSRSNSRVPRKRSRSPHSQRGRRSASEQKSSRPGLKSRGSSTIEGFDDAYSDSDGGHGSVSSSRRDQLASAEISAENILQDGRRKRPKFDSFVCRSTYWCMPIWANDYLLYRSFLSFNRLRFL